MEWLLIGTGVGLVPIALAIWLPQRWLSLRRDRKIASRLQGFGVFALVGGSIWYLLLVPQLFLSAGCGLASTLLMVVSLFTLSLPCQNSIVLWMDMAERLVAVGVACLAYGTARKMVLAKH